jgi:hypothetical protein
MVSPSADKDIFHPSADPPGTILLMIVFALGKNCLSGPTIMLLSDVVIERSVLKMIATIATKQDATASTMSQIIPCESINIFFFEKNNWSVFSFYFT